MEVEIKLRLPDAVVHRSLTTILSPHHLKTLHQENIFFDSPGSHLSRNLSALCLRFSGPSSAVLSLKSKPSIASGISREEETEEPLEESFARSCVSNPGRLLSIGLGIMSRVRGEFRVEELVCLGGFRNMREVYEWKGLKLELDETKYAFGTCYELECESEEPERDREVIEGMLVENGVSYSYSEVNKFAILLGQNNQHQPPITHLVPRDQGIVQGDMGGEVGQRMTKPRSFLQALTGDKEYRRGGFGMGTRGVQELKKVEVQVNGRGRTICRSSFSDEVYSEGAAPSAGAAGRLSPLLIADKTFVR